MPCTAMAAEQRFGKRAERTDLVLSHSISIGQAVMLDQITPMIITYNEIANIQRVLDALHWAKAILVIDSGSTDGTLDVLSADPRITVVTRAFDSFAQQCNFGLSHIKSPFVMSMDADYVVTPELVVELAAMTPGAQDCGFRTAFTYCVHGRPLRGTLYPPRITIYRPDMAHYVDVGHAHQLQPQGVVHNLSARIRHDDRKPIRRWLNAQIGYAEREADHLLGAKPGTLGFADRMRRMAWPAPFMALGYTLIAKRGLLDGWAGWHYTLQRVFAELLLCLLIVEKRLASAASVRNDERVE
jgi:glycosyltransferase involved in cell wall biosynthesis